MTRKKLTLQFQSKKITIMNKVVTGIVIGFFTGYLIRKMQDDGQFDCIYDNAHKFFGKSEKDLKNIQMKPNI